MGLRAARLRKHGSSGCQVKTAKRVLECSVRPTSVPKGTMGGGGAGAYRMPGRTPVPYARPYRMPGRTACQDTKQLPQPVTRC